MGALIAAANYQNRRISEAEVVPESIKSKLSKLPDEKDREFDVVLGILMLNG